MNTASLTHAERHTAAALDIRALLGSAAWSRLSPATQRRFAAHHVDVSYAGEMQLHSSRVGRVFAQFGRLLGSPLAASRAEAVPTKVQVSRDRQGGVVWTRQLGEAGQPGCQTVRSTKRLSPRGSLEECTEGGLSMDLQVCVEDGALVFYSRRYFYLLGRWRLPVPALLTPGVCRVEHRDEGEGHFRFTLDMVHPLWGRTFHQTGVFVDPA